MIGLSGNISKGIIDIKEMVVRRLRLRTWMKAFGFRANAFGASCSFSLPRM